jgi:group II intron reverse transcriptase/maturase
MRENRTCSLSGGRRLARKRASSDPTAKKLANKAGLPAAEQAEPRAGTEGNAEQQRTRRAQNRESVSQKLERVRQAAKLRKKERFTALLHHVTVEFLEKAFYALRRKAAPGVDGQTWTDYEGNLEAHLRDLHSRIHSGAYRALPVRRRFILKFDGKQRPLGVTALEDKIVQRAVVEILNAVYEADFLGFSYGFRPGRSQHDALDALATGITTTPVNWILDADIKGFFDAVNQEWLVRFMEHRIGDTRIIRLVQKWLKAGVLNNGELSVSELGTPQGAVASPLLANVYLHYVFDLWADRWRRREAKGKVIIVRYADDIVVGFQYEADGRRFWDAMRERLAQFALTLHPDKTRLLEFGRYAAERRQQRGLGKPETFTFLGFTHVCSKARRGTFMLRRKSRADRMRAKLRDIKEQLRKRMHESIPVQGTWLAQVVRGYFAYHAVPMNIHALQSFRHNVMKLWRRTLRRRSQKDSMTWERMERLGNDWLPPAKILHPWPERRFAVKHSR